MASGLGCLARALQRGEAQRGKGSPFSVDDDGGLGPAIAGHSCALLVGLGRGREGLRKGGPVLLGISGEERGRRWPFPSQGHLVGGAGGRGDKGADVGDASTPIMEDGPTHTAALGRRPH